MDKAILLKERVLQGYKVTKEDILSLRDCDVTTLSKCADEIRQHFCQNAFDMCSIINGKSGRCSEDCKYCAQSAHYETGAACYPMLGEEDIVKVAKENESEGVLRYSIVTSGKRLSQKDMEKVCTLYKAVKASCSIKLCASHGLLDYEDFLKLKEAGVTRYHNNLETSRRYFKEVCTTHTYEDKIGTLKAAQKAGLEVCSGGLFGMGETMEDRIDMAFELRDLGVLSIPINVLVPISGTPLGDVAPLTEQEVLRTIALYRYIHPKAVMRLAGGRESFEKAGEYAFRGGVNGTITGNLLTTCGNTIKDDMALVKSCGFEVKHVE